MDNEKTNIQIEKTLKKFSENLLRIMKEKRISRSDIASALNCTYCAVSCWTEGKNFPNDGKIYDLGMILDVPLFEFFKEVDKKTSKKGKSVENKTNNDLENNTKKITIDRFENLFTKLNRKEIETLKLTFSACTDLLRKES